MGTAHGHGGQAEADRAYLSTQHCKISPVAGVVRDRGRIAPRVSQPADVPEMKVSIRHVGFRAVPLMSMALVIIAAPLVFVQSVSDAPDLDMYRRIRDEGTLRSQVMDLATELIDGIGPRLTGSPNLARAVTWSQARLRQMGLSNVRTDSWGEFGMGWQERNVWLRMVEPETAPFIVRAAPWSPSTKGPITADVVSLRGFADEKEFEPHRGKLANKIVLLGRAVSLPEAFPIDKPLSDRLDDKALADFATAPARPTDEPDSDQMSAQMERLEKSCRLLAVEGARAVMIPSGNNARGGASGGTIYVDFNAVCGLQSHQKARAIPLPFAVVALEHYGRMKRLLDRQVPVKVELNIDTAFTGDRQEGLNVLAEIPGVDPARKGEVVMAAAHLDSWAAGTGATDDGAGVVIVMEAMRILRALAVKPARTIRVALWTGEEQGALGSLSYVNRQIATIPRVITTEQSSVPELWRRRSGPVVPMPDHAHLSAIYTLDAGGGRIRGVSLSGNAALVPIFQRWTAPLHDLGMTMVGLRDDCGGDCRPFAEAGIPTPSFKQDPLEYDTRTHHTNMDTYERLVPEDLRQAAVIVATMLYNTAMRSERLPR